MLYLNIPDIYDGDDDNDGIPTSVELQNHLHHDNVTDGTPISEMRYISPDVVEGYQWIHQRPELLRRCLAMSKKSKTAEEIIFSGETESVVKWRKSGLLYPLILFIAIIIVSMLPVSGNILIDMKYFWIYSLTFDYGIVFISVWGAIILLIIISGVI